MNPVVTVKHVSKTFHVPQAKHTQTLDHIIFGQTRRDTFTAVQDISFTVNPGEWFGIIGPNGSGKSTLLKCIAGIYQPTTGRVTTTQPLTPVFAFGAGFNLNLTARENIYINGLGLGLTRQKIHGIYDDIINFTELTDFVNLPLRHYSTGMIRRLGLAIALQVQGRILILDEIFTAGDLSFQQKALTAIKKLRDNGETIIMVSHGLPRIATYCSRAIYIKAGTMQHIGPAKEVVRHYQEDT